MPPPTILHRPEAGPSSSIYPSFNHALETTQALEVPATIQTFKRIEQLDRPRDPRPAKKRALQARISAKAKEPRPKDDEVVSLYSEDEMEVDSDIVVATGLSGPSTRYEASCITSSNTDVALAYKYRSNTPQSIVISPIQVDTMIENDLVNKFCKINLASPSMSDVRKCIFRTFFNLYFLPQSYV
jgi:hypothetical protein